MTLYRDGEPYDAKTLNVGLRKLSLSEKKLPFSLTLNGTSFFVTGAEYCPEDVLLTKCTRELTDERIRALSHANVNYLRVRKGARYLTDDFFDLCDRYGILVGMESDGADASLTRALDICLDG